MFIEEEWMQFKLHHGSSLIALRQSHVSPSIGVFEQADDFPLDWKPHGPAKFAQIKGTSMASRLRHFINWPIWCYATQLVVWTRWGKTVSERTSRLCAEFDPWTIREFTASICVCEGADGCAASFIILCTTAGQSKVQQLFVALHCAGLVCSYLINGKRGCLN